TDSRYVLDGLTMHARAWEDRGWIGVANAVQMQRALALLRARSAPTTLRWVRGHSGVQGNEAADALAREGAGARPVHGPRERVRDEFLLCGASLPCLSQSLAYRGIRERNLARPRQTTVTNIEAIVTDLTRVCGSTRRPAEIWLGLHARLMRKQVRDFLWKSIHGVLRVGKYWTNIPGFEDRELCPFCNVREDLAHILLSCRAPGRRVIWGLATAALERKGIRACPDSLGLALAPHMFLVRDEKGAPHGANTRVARIVLSEAAYLIWTLRCERVIAWERDPNRSHTAREITRKWEWSLTKRLRMDQAAARRAGPKKRSALIATVEKTWGGIIRNAETLPPDWALCAGVLVGIPADNP
ncbi:hypothetical protein C2E23DRAFT_735656, partial [Lenzites betulinus]